MMSGVIDRSRLRPWVSRLACGLGLTTLLTAQTGPPRDTLDIYWIDVEGGAATLIVTPRHESVLMDTGWDRPDDRDARRIAAALRDARLDRLDYVITSHFHPDHVGGLAALADMVDIGQFIDHGGHGADVALGSDVGRILWRRYQEVVGDRRRAVQPGDKLRLQGIELTFVVADGAILPRPLLPMGANPLCDVAVTPVENDGENRRSLGYLLSLGAFQFLNLGDLTPGVQHALACPEHKLGAVDIYQIPHHGDGVVPELKWALRPTVAVIANGPHKGGTAEGYDVVAGVDTVEDIWQLHRALDTGDAHNSSERFIANLTDEPECEGYWLKASVHPDGRSYFVGNRRTGTGRTYVSQ